MVQQPRLGEKSLVTGADYSEAHERSVISAVLRISHKLACGNVVWTGSHRSRFEAHRSGRGSHGGRHRAISVCMSVGKDWRIDKVEIVPRTV